MYVNSRNFTLALKTDRPSRLRVQDLDPATGQIMEKELPEYLQNFEIQSPLKREDSKLQDQLFDMR
jgi:hypothetical protein